MDFKIEEIYPAAVYCNIISGLLIRHKVSSPIKLAFYAFYCKIRQYSFVPSPKKFGVETQFFDQLGSAFIGNQRDFIDFYKAFDLMKQSGHLLVTDGKVYPTVGTLYSVHHPVIDSSLFSQMLQKTNLLSDSDFLMEVAAYAYF